MALTDSWISGKIHKFKPAENIDFVLVTLYLTSESLTHMKSCGCALENSKMQVGFPYSSLSSKVIRHKHKNNALFQKFQSGISPLSVLESEKKFNRS
jgi:hypothetical protein